MITGARKGLGRFLRDHYLAQGCSVIGCSRAEVGDSPPGYQHFVLDVSDDAAVQRMFADVRKSHGRIDVLINNAGVASMNHFLLTPLASVRRILETNVVGTFLCCREGAKLMQRARHGRIVNVVSVAVPLRLEGEAIYAASKAAVVTLTEVLAREVADVGITVNAVGPAPMETDLLRSVPPETVAELLKRLPLHRLGKFSEVANVIDFLIRPESAAVTGQTIYLGGA